MVVFIDDLDRCSDDVVVKICEAVKLYLDAPGLIFVLACDESVPARGIASLARGGAAEGRSYLEKIIQVVYLVPPPDDDGVRELIKGYAAKSRTGDLIKDQVAKTLAHSTSRNPRKIKRIINSFILEQELSSAWRSAPLSSTHLVTVILLQPVHGVVRPHRAGHLRTGSHRGIPGLREAPRERRARQSGPRVGRILRRPGDTVFRGAQRSATAGPDGDCQRGCRAAPGGRCAGSCSAIR